MIEENGLESRTTSERGELQPTPQTVEPAERRGKVLAISVLCGLFAIPLCLESLQIHPGDLMSSLGDPEVTGLALMHVGISTMGWLRLMLWSFLLSFAYRGRGWARTTVAALAALRGAVAVYYVVASGFRSELAIFFLLVGGAYLVGAFLLLRSPDLVLYLTRQRARA